VVAVSLPQNPKTPQVSLIFTLLSALALWFVKLPAALLSDLFFDVLISS
jgi:hypothetical protein